MRCLLVCLAVGTSVWAQSTGRGSDRQRPARVEGKVVSDLDGGGLKRAHVVLRPVDSGAGAGLPSVGTDTDDQGAFELRDIAPGRYTLTADRDSYLPSSVCLHGTLRMPVAFTLGAGQSLTSITFRLRPWAVIAGRIRFEDGEPAVNVRVEAYRESVDKGRRHYTNTTGAITNDRGEYRIHDLRPGAYVIAAVYERTVENVDPRSYLEQSAAAALGYATTFYPDTVRFNEAVAIRLDYGREQGGVDIFLRPIRKVKIRGRVTGGVSGAVVTGAAIYLQRMDAHNHASVDAPAHVGYDRQGNFEVRDVTPGLYMMTAAGDDQGEAMRARAVVTVPEQDVDNVELVLQSPRKWRGNVVIEGGGNFDPKQTFRFRLEPHSERVQNVTVAVGGAEFDCVIWPEEVYDAYAQDLPGDFFLSAVRVNGSDVMGYGLEGAQASGTPFQIVLDSRGGGVTGLVMAPDGNVLSGASLALIPDPPQGRLQAYREVQADEYGQFQIHGVAPGKYVLIGWLDDPPCDYGDPDALDACRAAGTQVTVGQAGQQNLTFTVKH
jgi:Carboxypeptidase regulatory-like domain